MGSVLPAAALLMTVRAGPSVRRGASFTSSGRSGIANNPRRVRVGLGDVSKWRLESQEERGVNEVVALQPSATTTAAVAHQETLRSL